MTDVANLAELRRLACLREVPAAEVRWLADHVVPATFEPGATMIVEGDASRDCYFIVEGLTRVTSGGAVLGDSGPGEPEGEMALFFDRRRMCTTTAVSHVRALVLRADDFDDLRRADPAAAGAIEAAVLRHLARRFATINSGGLTD